MVQPDATPPAVVGDDDAPLCPHCGYDLRGTSGEICSECGQTVERAALMHSAIPWANARGLGRIWAYIVTVWLVTIGSKRLRHEASKPQDLGAALWFGRVTGVLVGLSLAGTFVAYFQTVGSLADLAVRPDRNIATNASELGWLEDVLVPLSAGATLPGVVPLVLFVGGIMLAKAHQRLMRPSHGTSIRQQRAGAVGCYASGPLAWMPIAAGLTWLSWLGDVEISKASPAQILIADYLAPQAMPFLWGLVAIAALYRVAQTAGRIRCGGLGNALAAAGYVLIAWPVTLLAGGLWVWAIGYGWIVIDSFR